MSKAATKTHETVLEIDLDKMGRNLGFFRSHLKPTTKVMAMVKALAYGNGSVEVSAWLEEAGADYLAVAYADEGATIREAGITLPIMVLNPLPESFGSLIRHNLEPQISNFTALREFTESLPGHVAESPYPVHIKLNTGMNRLGFDAGELDQLAPELMRLQNRLLVKSVFSHLPATEDESFDEFTKAQIRQFKNACERLERSGLSGFMKHILNSTGILRHGEAQMDMVRLGLGLYGLSSHEKFVKRLEPVGRLKTILAQVRNVKKGGGVGYSPKTFLTTDKRIGIIAIGYADGLPRSLGNGKGSVVINRRKAPFIGNICMDMSMVDLSDIEGLEGDEVEIFGEENSIYEMAEKLGTIPYEVLTNISQRVKRVFLRE